MKYEKILKATFIERMNRFVARVFLDGKEVYCHVKNTGRCKELLLEGVTVYIEDCKDSKTHRKYRYSLISVEKKIGDSKILINIDSQAPNKVFEEALLKGISLDGFGRVKTFKREYTSGDSRLDFYIENEDSKEGLVEVKGVTLERDGVLMFPDAPTLRGVKHIRELISASNKGYYSAIVFIVQMNYGKYLCPNYETHFDFAKILEEAKNLSVNIFCYLCDVSSDSLTIGNKIPIIFGEENMIGNHI